MRARKINLWFAGTLLLFTQDALAAESYPVTVKPYKELVIYPRFDAPATVVSLADAKLAAQIQARIKNIPVRVGERVKRDQVLVELECDDYVLARRKASASRDAAQARLKLARYQLKRTQSLRQSKSVSEELFNQREANIKITQADLETASAAFEGAKLDQGRCIVRAPYAAVVLERMGQAGELANTGSVLMRVVDIEHLEISAQVPADLVAGLIASDTRWLTFQKQRYPVTLRSVSPVIEPRERSQEVRLLFSATTAPVGAAGRLRWQSNNAHLSSELLVERNGRFGVFTVEAGHARFVPVPDVQPGRPFRARLSPQSRLIIDGRYGVKDADSIREVN